MISAILMHLKTPVTASELYNLVSFNLPENAWKVGSSVQVAAKQICAGEEVIDSVKNSILKMNKTTLSTMCLAEL